MNCTSCGEENRESAKFCAECGTPISRACAHCDHPLSSSSKFCDECGTPVDPAAEPAAVPADDGAVRRTVTIMFADLVGSTAFGESVDAETARREMGGYHELTRTVAEAHGGAVIKFIGDGVMVGFGVNEVAEDDADRAVRAGLDLQRRFEEISAGIHARHGTAVGLRVGINTGEVVIAEDDADMVGDPINTAARIEAQCTPGRVLVGEQTWRLTRSTVDYEVLGEVDVKGKSEPIATFQVLAAVEDEEVATPFVGRAAELATLTAALENTIAEGAPQLVSVIGSPGVGKTRLAAELAGRASEVTSFDLRVDRAGAATFEPVADLLRAVSDLPTGLSDEATTEHLRTFVGEADDADRLVPLLAGFVGAAPMRSTEESFWAARRLVELVAATRPAVIVVDDIQWAEPLFLDLLEHLVEWTEGAAFVIALARPEIRDIRPAFAEVGRRVTEVIALEGLDPTTMAELATGILGGKALPDELIARLPDSTEGNPLFVRELVRMLVDDAVIAETPSGWVLAIDADAVEVPPTIISLLASRVERMDDEERRVVEAASVVGSEFARGAVGTLLPNLGAAQLDRILERLRRQEIVDPTGSYWGDEPVWRFHHVLIRDAAYRRLLKERRIDMHRRVGQWTEATAAALGGEHEISIAFHYEQAHGYLRELGTVDGDTAELGGRAADLLALAAERALARDDLASAGSLATRALGVLDESDPRRPELLLSACEAWFGAGRVRDGAPHLDELRRHTGDDRIAAWTAAFEGQHVVLTEPARLNEVEPLVADAAARLADVGDDAGVAKARLVRALILARTGRVGECEDELDAALAAARAADDRRRITAVLGAAPVAALWGPSPVARAGGRCLDIIRLLRITSASPMVEAVSIRCQAVLEAMRGRFDEARTLIDRSQAIVEELGLRHGILECRMFAGYIELLAGDSAAAEPHLRVAHAGLGTLGVGADAGQAAALLSRSLLAQGRVDEAAELADESARLAGQNLQTGIASRTAQAEIAAHQGRIDDALRLADEAVAIGAETDLTMDHATALVGLAEVQHLHGDQRAANDSTRLARQLFAEKGAVVAEAPTRERFDFRASATETLATRYARASSAALYDRRDVAAWEALCHPDGVFIDRRSLHDDVTDLAGRRALQLDIIRGLSSYDTALVATRGERLCVFANTVRFDDDRSEISILNVLEVDEGGLLLASVLFDPDDFPAAIDELTERFVVGEGAPFAHVIEAVRNHTVASIDDIDAFNESMTDDYRFVDHRALLQAVTDRDDASWRSDDVDLRRLFLQRIDRLSDHGLVGTCTSHSSQDTIEAEWSWVLVQHVRDGRPWRTEIYDEADLELALDRFESMSAAGTLANHATHVSRQFWSRLFDDLDVDAAMEIMAGAVNDERALQLPDSAPVVMRQLLEESLVGVSRVDYEFAPVALRGDRHIAARVWARYHPTEIEREIFTTARLEGGRLADIHIFDDVDDAYTALEASFRDHEGAEFAEVLDILSQAQRARATGDRETTATLIRPGGRYLDHRAGQQMTDELGAVQAHTETTELSGAVRTTQLHRLAEEGWVASIIADFTDPEGFSVQWRTCAVNLVDGGQITHWEVYDEHDVELACARFDELTAARTLDNDAARVSREFWRRLYEDFDVDGAMELIAGGSTDSRPLQILTADEPLQRSMFEETLAGVTHVDYEFEVLAIRGDNHVANRMLARYQPSEVEKEVHETGRLVDGRIADTRVFDNPDEAYAELERQYRAHEGAEFADVLDAISAQSRALADLDMDRTWDLAHRDCAVVDHRQLQQIDAKLTDTMAAHAAAGFHGAVVVEQFHRLNEHGAVFTEADDFRDGHGTQVEFRTCQVRIIRDGKLARWEIFAETDRDVGCARFDELTADRTLTNRAFEGNREFFRRIFEEHDLDGAMTLVRPEWASSDERGLHLADLDSATAPEWFALGDRPHAWSTEAVAIRGDRLALSAMRVGGAGRERQFLLVSEVDESGLAIRDAQFEADDLRPALDLLNQWYIEGEGAPYREMIETGTEFAGTGRLPNEERIARLTEILHEDFTLVDHRAFSLPDIDRSALLEMDDAEEARTSISPAFLRLAPNALLTISEDRTANTTGGEVLHRHLAVQAQRGGRVTNLEFFAEDQLAEAEARFEELARADRRLRNLATDAADGFYARLARSDLEGALAMLGADWSMRDNRDLALADLDRVTAEAWFAQSIAEEARRWTTETIAIRGRSLAAMRVGSVGANAEWAYLLVIEADDEGHSRRAEIFDPDELRPALDRLNDCYLEGEGSAHRAVFELGWALGKAQEVDSTEQTAALVTLMHDDVQMEDHRRFSIPAMDRTSVSDARNEILFRPYSVIVPEYLAFNDQGMLLVQENHETTETGGHVVHRQLTLLVARDGKAARIEWYDDDDRDAALARFHELTAPAPANAASRQLSSFWRATYRERDLDAAFALLRDDFVSTDHRRLVSSPTLTRAEVRNYLELFIGSTNEEIDHEFEVIATRDDHLVLARIDPRDGRSGFGREMLQLGEFGADGLAVRATSYSPEDRDRALRDFEALGGLGPLENTASRLARSFYESVFDRGDMEPALRLVADDFAGEDRRPLIDVRLGKIDLSVNFAAIVDDATAWDWRLEMFAIAGDRLALYRLSPAEEASSFSSPHLQVIETDGSRIIGGVSFEPDDFESAGEELYRRYRDGEGAEFATTLDSGWLVLRQFDDPDARRDALADDFTYIDHRSMGFGTLDRDGYLDLLTVGREMAGQRRVMTRRFVAIDHGIVLREALIGTDELSWPALVIVVQRDGRICRQESFDVADLDAALARFEELRPANRGEVPPLRNGATDGLHAFYTKMYDDRDIEGAMTLVRDDFIGDDRRSVVSSVIDATDFTENFRGPLDHDGSVEWELEPIAVAGERLGLARHRTTRSGSGFAVELLIIIEIDEDGLGTAVVSFDLDDLDAAVAEMDRRYLAGEGAEYREALELGLKSRDTANDPEAMRQLLTDDFVLSDRRAIGFGDHDADGYAAILRSGLEAGGPRHLLVRQPLRLHPAAVLSDIVLTGGGSEWPALSIIVGRGGRICRQEFWDINDRDAALARFDELTAAPKRGNRASEVDLEFRAAVRDRDTATLGELVAEDAIFVDHRKLAPRPVDTIDGVVESVHAYTDQSMSHTFDLVAAYGEKVAFVEVTIAADTGFDVQLFTVTEIDDEGRVCRFETFDAESFDAAQRRAADRWLDAEAPEARPAIEPLMDLSDAFGRNDFAAIAALLAPDFRHTVSKPLTAEGEFDAAGFLENMRVWVEMSGSIRNVTRAMVEWSRHGAVLVSEIHATDPTGMVTEWASTHVLVVADGKITHWEEFETHTLDPAVARFDELTAEPPTPANLVIRAFGEETGSVASGGFDPREAYSDAVIVDHRPGVVPLTSIDDLARSVAAFDEHDMDFRYEAVAWRGELVGLLRMTRSTSSGMRAVWFNLIQADHDGRPARVEFFGEDHLDEALRRLDELWWENENPGIRPFGELLRSFGDRIDAGDWDGVRELLHPQFRHVVRKQLESEEYDTEGFVASTEIWREMAGSAISVSREVVRHDDASILVRHDINATDEAGMETQWSALVIGIGENGLVRWWEELEPDDLDAAVARYEELTGTLGPASTE